MAKQPGSQGQGDGGDGQHGQVGVGNSKNTGAFQVDAAYGFDGKAHGVDIGHVLQDLRHVADRCRQSRQEYHGHEE